MQKLLRVSMLFLLGVFGLTASYAAGETFDFTTNDYGLTHIVQNSDNATKYQKDYDESLVLTGLDNVTLSMDRNGGNGFRLWETTAGATTFRAYSKSIMTIAAPAGKKISQIVIVGTATMDKFSAAGYSASSDKTSGTWSGSAASVSFSAGGTVTMQTINVTLVADDGKKDATVTISATKIRVGNTAIVSTDGPAVTLATSDPAIASVEGTTITGVGNGTAVITVTWNAEGDYNGGETNFNLTVEAPHEIVDGVFNFNGLQNYGSGIEGPKTSEQYGDSNYDSEATTWTAGNVTLVPQHRYRWFEATNGSRSLRLYQGTVGEETVKGSITVSVPADYVITNIAFAGTNTTDAFSANSGTVAGQAWTGSAQSVELTHNATGAIQLTSVTVTYSAAGDQPAVAAPGVAVDKTEAEEGETVIVTFSHPNLETGNETTFYYTTDGSEPTTESANFITDDTESASVQIVMGTTDLVIVAKAEVDGTLSEASAAKTVTYKESQGGGATVVTLPYSNTLLSATIPEGFSVEGEESIWTFTTNYGVKATSGSKVEKEAYLVSPFVDMTSASAPKMQFEHAGKFFGTPADEATLWAREEGGAWQQVTIPTYFTNTNWNWVVCEIDLTAYAGKKVQFGFKYNSTTANYGTWEIKNLNIADGEVVITYEDHTIASLNQATAAIEHVNLTLNNAIVTYVETPRVYVREGDESILFYNTGINFTKGNTVSGTVKVKLDIYKGLREVVKITDVTNADDLTITAPSAEPVATEKTLAQILAGESVSDLVAVKGVTIEYEAPAATSSAPADIQHNAADEAGTYYAVSGSDKVLIYNNNFTAVTLTADMNGKQYDIEGVVSVFNNTPQLMPTKMTDVSTGINGLTNDEAEQSGAIYNLSGQRVDRNYKGIVIVNGKKLLKK